MRCRRLPRKWEGQAVRTDTELAIAMGDHDLRGIGESDILFQSLRRTVQHVGYD